MANIFYKENVAREEIAQCGKGIMANMYATKKERQARIFIFKAYHQLKLMASIRQWFGASCPVYTTDTLIPEDLIKKISWRWESGCKTTTWGCRKHGLRCSDLCSSCHGETCTDIEQPIILDMDNDTDIIESEEPISEDIN